MKKKPSQKKLAFSLLELSIVLVVISFLMLTVLKGGQMVSKSKIVGAASLTRASIVDDIEDLALWLETTRAESLDEEEASTDELVTNWYDLADTSFTEYQAQQLTGDNKPSYDKNSINNLPSLYFDGTDHMQVANGFDNNSESVTIFLVVKPTTAAGTLNYFLEKSTGSTSFPYALSSNTTFTLSTSDGTSSPSISSTTSRQSGIVNLVAARKVKSGDMQLWLDGVEENIATNDNSSSGANSQNLTIGCEGGNTNCFTGNIGEIIIYARAITDEEKESVEKYLSSKWGIDID